MFRTVLVLPQAGVAVCALPMRALSCRRRALAVFLIGGFICTAVTCEPVVCTDEVQPDPVRCPKLQKFFSKRPSCSTPTRRRKLCCAAAFDFFTHGCHCASTSNEALLTFVEARRDRCASGASGAVERKLRGDGKGFRVFVGVLSSAKNADRRNAIRQTWGGDSRLHRVMFFVSRPRDERLFDAVRREAAEKDDLVVLGHVWESYDNITYQTFEVCRAAYVDGHATHVMKVDDDSYLRVTNLLGELAAMPKLQAFLGFIENPGGGPHRNKDSQWYVGWDEWASDRYPPWAHGTGYVITYDVSKQIATGVPYKLLPDRLFKLEDISMGSWVEFVGKDLGWDIKLVGSTRFNYGGCTPHDVVSHYINAERQLCMWKKGGRCCHHLPHRPHKP